MQVLLTAAPPSGTAAENWPTMSGSIHLVEPILHPFRLRRRQIDAIEHLGPMNSDRTIVEVAHVPRAIEWARVFSNIVSPPTIFAAIGFPVAWRDLPFWPGFLWGWLYAICISGIPMLVVVFLLRTGRIGDLHMRHARERHIPYLVTFLCAVGGWVVLRFAGGPRLLGMVLLCNAIGLAMLGLINVVWLVSNHSGSISGATVLMGLMYGPGAVVAMLPLVAMVFAARLKLRRHTMAQLVAGVAVGAAPVLLFAALGLIP
jgi:hypothetical protein